MFAAIGPGTTVDLNRGCYRVGNVTQPPNTTVRGAMGYGDPFLSATAGGVQTDPYLWGGQIRRIQGTIYNATNGDRFTNVVFVREGLLPAGFTFPLRSASQAAAIIANFGDTAIKSDQASIEVDHSTFLGFTWSLYANNSGGGGISSKVRFSYNLVDGTNGLYAGASGDPHLIDRNHIFPFLTIAARGVGMQKGQSRGPMQRAGTAIYLQGPDTGSRITNNLEFGFANGLKCIACSQVDVENGHFENIGGPDAKVGLSLTGQYLQAVGNFVIGYNRPVDLDGLTSSTGENNPSGNDTITFALNQVVGSDGGNCVFLQGGWGNITDNLFQNCATALAIGSRATGGIVSRNRFVGVVNNYSNRYIGTRLNIDDPSLNPGSRVVNVLTGRFNYTAGPSTETIYLWGGVVSEISIGTRRIFVNSTGQTINLSPFEVLSIVSSTAPKMISDIK